MAFVIDQSVYDAVRADLLGNSPSAGVPAVVFYFDAYRNSLENSLSSQGVSGLSQGALEVAWCSLVAHGMAPYGEGAQDNRLASLLDSTTFQCGNYVSLTWYLSAQFSSAGANLSEVDWGRGSTFGDHSQLFYSDGTTSLLIDPTVALIVNNVEIPALCNGEVYLSVASFNLQSSISWFSDKIVNAVTHGDYRSWYAKYAFSNHTDLLNYSPSCAGITFANPDGSTTIVGASWADAISGSAIKDYIYGVEGNDSLFGEAGSDALYGGDGNDILYGGADHDLLDGGNGWDRVEYAHVTANLMINLATGVATGEGNDTLVGIENVTGGSGNDWIKGNATSNVLIGGLGNDSLFGEAGSDALYGGDGNDFIDGGIDADQMYGGSGSDIFHFGSLDEVGLGTTQDCVADFDCQFDRLDFTGFDANTVLDGNQAFSFLGTASFSGEAGQLRFDSGTLWGDVSGDMVADFGIKIIATGVLADANFIL